MSAAPLSLPAGDVLKAAFGGFPSGVAAVCAEHDGERNGFVVSSFASGISFDPPMVLFSVMKRSTTWPRLRKAARIGVSILSEKHGPAGRALSSRQGDRFAGIDVLDGDGGALFVAGCPVHLECEIVSETPAGDHDLVLLRIMRAGIDHGTEPIIYHGSKFRHLAA